MLIYSSLNSYNNQLDNDNSLSSIAITFSLSLAAAAVIGFVVYRYTKKGKLLIMKVINPSKSFFKVVAELPDDRKKLRNLDCTKLRKGSFIQTRYQHAAERRLAIF